MRQHAPLSHPQYCRGQHEAASNSRSLIKLLMTKFATPLSQTSGAWSSKFYQITLYQAISNNHPGGMIVSSTTQYQHSCSVLINSQFASHHMIALVKGRGFNSHSVHFFAPVNSSSRTSKWLWSAFCSVPRPRANTQSCPLPQLTATESSLLRIETRISRNALPRCDWQLTSACSQDNALASRRACRKIGQPLP